MKKGRKFPVCLTSVFVVSGDLQVSQVLQHQARPSSSLLSLPEVHSKDGPPLSLVNVQAKVSFNECSYSWATKPISLWGGSCSTAVECMPRNREVVGLIPPGGGGCWAFSLFYPPKSASLIQVLRGGATLLIFIWNKLGCAAWSEASLVWTDWAKKADLTSLVFCLPGSTTASEKETKSSSCSSRYSHFSNFLLLKLKWLWWVRLLRAVRPLGKQPLEWATILFCHFCRVWPRFEPMPEWPQAP